MDTNLTNDRNITMIVNHYFEPTIGGHVIRLCGRDSAGNDLEQEIEFLIITHHEQSAVTHSVEALVALMRGIDDFLVVSTRDIPVADKFPVPWQVNEIEQLDEIVKNEIIGNETVGNEENGVN